MADAEIIPIGTRGRPGRGTGSPKPSSAARNLAAKPAPKAAPRPAAKAAATKPRTATPRPTSKPAAAEAIEQVTTEAVPPAAAPPGAPPRPAATTADRGPLAGIAPDVWLSMLQGAAREVWGEQWEP